MKGKKYREKGKKEKKWKMFYCFSFFSVIFCSKKREKIEGENVNCKRGLKKNRYRKLKTKRPVFFKEKGKENDIFFEHGILFLKNRNRNIFMLLQNADPKRKILCDKREIFRNGYFFFSPVDFFQTFL